MRSLCDAAATEQSWSRKISLQRLHAATFRGVVMLINSRPVMRMGPEVPPGGLIAAGAPPAPAAGDKLYHQLALASPRGL